jgi:hydroxymethylpyrimidine/phosphomethylpyrimidine kinase
LEGADVVTGPIVCTIGTTDPWNAAGLGLDVRALTECGARAVSVVTGVSAQDARGVRSVHAVPAATIEAQFEALAAAPIAAYRIGALPGLAAIGVVANRLATASVPVVYDPVLAATAGGAFLDEAGIAALVSRLLPRASVVTPNLDEARRLTGVASIDDVDAMGVAARALVRLGAGAALVTGGHLRGAPIDVLFDGELRTFEAARLTGTMRGTGCLLADALAAALARGLALASAVEEARGYVRRKLQRAIELGGMRVAD